MKFRDMSWEELQKDFINFLNSKTDEELFASFEKYIIINDKYSYVINEENNIEEKIEYDVLKEKNDINDVKFNLNLQYEEEIFYELEAA